MKYKENIDRNTEDNQLSITHVYITHVSITYVLELLMGHEEKTDYTLTTQVRIELLEL